MTNKFHHVRHAVLDPATAHCCAWPDCAMMIPGPQCMCASHWNTLPKIYRDRIWNAYEIGQEADARLASEEYLAALSAARDWARRYRAALEGTGQLRAPAGSAQEPGRDRGPRPPAGPRPQK